MPGGGDVVGPERTLVRCAANRGFLALARHSATLAHKSTTDADLHVQIM